MAFNALDEDIMIGVRRRMLKQTQTQERNSSLVKWKGRPGYICVKVFAKAQVLRTVLGLLLNCSSASRCWHQRCAGPGSHGRPVAVFGCVSASSAPRASSPNLQSRVCSRGPGRFHLSVNRLATQTLRTSAAAAAAALGSSAAVGAVPPTVRPGPVSLAGTDAFVAGAGAEPTVRPAPWKFSSLEDLPQRLPIEVVNVRWDR